MGRPARAENALIAPSRSLINRTRRHEEVLDWAAHVVMQSLHKTNTWRWWYKWHAVAPNTVSPSACADVGTITLATAMPA